MSPENQWLEDVRPNWNSPFLGDMLIFGGVYIYLFTIDMYFINLPFIFPKYGEDDPSRRDVFRTGCSQLTPCT